MKRKVSEQSGGSFGESIGGGEEYWPLRPAADQPAQRRGRKVLMVLQRSGTGGAAGADCRRMRSARAAG